MSKQDGDRPHNELVERLTREAERAAAAAGVARAARERSQMLREFVRAFRQSPDTLPRRCAWCGRVEVGGRYVRPEDFLRGDLPERLRDRATHGICPDCLERESRAAERTRAGG